MERCENFDGLQLLHSINGGTGSGFASNLLSRLSVDYPKKHKFTHTIVPSPKVGTSTVEIYNAVLSFNNHI